MARPPLIWPWLALALATGSLAPSPARAQGGERIAERFARLDADGDGALSPAELDRPSLFRRLDRDGDGALSLSEVQAGLSALRGGAAEVTSRSRAGSTSEAGLKVTRDLVYREDVGPRAEVSLDLYASPEPGPPRPLLVMVHGGGWVAGDKANRSVWEAKARHWVGQGWVFASVNYRLARAGEHPSQVDDLARALAYLHDRAAAHGIDPQRLFLIGHSAGAHLASLVACDPAPLERAGKSLAILRGVISLDSAAYDVARSAQREGPRKVALYRRAFGDESSWAAVSPQTHVAAGRAHPPFLLVHAGQRAASRLASQEFAAALRAAGAAVEVVGAPERDHGSLNAKLGTPGDPTTARVDAFLAALAR